MTELPKPPNFDISEVDSIQGNDCQQARPIEETCADIEDISRAMKESILKLGVPLNSNMPKADEEQRGSNDSEANNK